MDTQFSVISRAGLESSATPKDMAVVDVDHLLTFESSKINDPALSELGGSDVHSHKDFAETQDDPDNILKGCGENEGYSWGTDDEQAEAEKAEDDIYDATQTSPYRPGRFNIHPQILRTALLRMDGDGNKVSHGEVQAQASGVLVPEDGNDWHKEFGQTDDSVWAKALQPISGNVPQQKRRSARIAQKAKRSTNGSVAKTLVGMAVVAMPVNKKLLSILSLPHEILHAVVKKIPDQYTLILFTLTCKRFAMTAFNIYPAGDAMWRFDDWEGFEDDYDCNRSCFLLSQPIADWMPLNMKYCRHCDKWTTYLSGAERKRGEYDDLVRPCIPCRNLKNEHRNHFHPAECYDLDTCARYSDWEHGTPKKKRWAESAWHPDLVHYVVHPDLAHYDEEVSSDSNDSENEDEGEHDSDDEENDSEVEYNDPDDDDRKCRTCRAGLWCGRH